MPASTSLADNCNCPESLPLSPFTSSSESVSPDSLKYRTDIHFTSRCRGSATEDAPPTATVEFSSPPRSPWTLVLVSSPQLLAAPSPPFDPSRRNRGCLPKLGGTFRARCCVLIESSFDAAAALLTPPTSMSITMFVKVSLMKAFLEDKSIPPRNSDNFDINCREVIVLRSTTNMSSFIERRRLSSLGMALAWECNFVCSFPSKAPPPPSSSLASLPPSRFDSLGRLFFPIIAPLTPPLRRVRDTSISESLFLLLPLSFPPSLLESESSSLEW